MHVSALLGNVRAANNKSKLRYHPTYKCFVVGPHQAPQKITGIHTQMQRVFGVKKGGWVGINPNSTSGREFKGGRTGRSLGIQIDNEMQKISTGKPLKTVHPYTKMLLDAMSKWGLKLVACQVPIFWPDANTATAIDMVLCDKETGQVMCVELKTGFDGYEDGQWENENKEPPAIHMDILDTAHNRNSMQVVLTVQILKHGYELKHAPYCSVWYVNKTGVHRRPPSDEVWDRRDELASVLQAGPPKKKKKKKKKKPTKKTTKKPKKTIAKKKTSR